MDVVFGTTIESNRYSTFSKAPSPLMRKQAIQGIKLPKMVSIEPVMDFDIDILIDWVRQIAPEFVSIGADSKRHNLPEPTPDKVLALIEELSKITIVKVKDNLRRLM